MTSLKSKILSRKFDGRIQSTAPSHLAAFCLPIFLWPSWEFVWQKKKVTIWLKENKCDHSNLQMLHTYSETSAMCLCLSLTQSMSSSFRIACFSKPSLDLYLIKKKQKQCTAGNTLATLKKHSWQTKIYNHMTHCMDRMKDDSTCRCHSGYRWGRKPWPGRSAHAGVDWLGQNLSPISAAVPASFPWDRKLQIKSLGGIIMLQEKVGVLYLCLLPIVGLYKGNYQKALMFLSSPGGCFVS